MKVRQERRHAEEAAKLATLYAEVLVRRRAQQTEEKPAEVKQAWEKPKHP